MSLQALPPKPVVLVFAGHDPSGGAGIQADIEAIASGGCHAVTVITALTVQDTRNAASFEPTTPALLRAQADTLLADIEPAAIKLGMLGSSENAHVIARLLQRWRHVPVILDPVLAAGGGGALATDDLRRVLRDELLPLATLATPNTPELRALAPAADTLAAGAQALLAGGCRHVLVTGGHEPGPEVVSHLYGARGEMARHAWPRLPGEFHGSGCTLASAVAARIAHGIDLAAAVDDALAYTWYALGNARRPGRGQAIPDRFFWTAGGRWQRNN